MTRRAGDIRLVAAMIAALVLSGCNWDAPKSTAASATPGGGAGTPSFSIGGTISGLTASGLSLTAANGNTVTVASGATSFTLPNLVAAGASYSVSVLSQPQAQTCSISSGSGTVGQANITNVQVNCSTNTYTVGGTITGVTVGGLMLANGNDTLAIPVGTSAFVFPTKVAAGAAYAVSVQAQPAGLNCEVIDGAGVIVAAPVINVSVACGQWAWMNGSDTAGASGTYGTKGTAAPANVPAARSAALSWLDGSGNLWLFGGAVSNGDLNDLWRYSPKAGEWTWLSGSNAANAAGVYGVQGVESALDVPGARAEAISWIDGAGDLWLFGGQGYDSAGTLGALNDLWKFDDTHGQWVWVNGSNTAWASGATPPANAPGARSGAVSWIDAMGNLWLFGGMGTQGLTNDLWEFTPSTSQWTLVSGSQTAGALGIYGTEGTAAAGNMPGSREQAVSSIDAAGNLWLFGGSGYGAIGSVGLLNDLWEFDPSTDQWTWVSGWKTTGAAGVYGTQSTTAVEEPGARSRATAATDVAGHLWLFGGVGYDSAGHNGPLNDMWEYDSGSKQWIWIAGSQTTAAAGVYGSEGVAAAGNVPGERSLAVSWMDGSGDFWLFGGQGWDSTETAGLLNDLWEFVP